MPLESQTEHLEAPRGFHLLTDHIRSGVVVLAVLVLGILIGRAMTGTPSAVAANPTVAGTATRSAELKELNDLRTKVAQPVVCTPAPTATPTSTPTPEPTATIVPARPAGTEVIDASGLGVNVLSIQPVPIPDGVEATGQLLRVNVRLSNKADSPVLPPFVEWRLVDSVGNRYSVDLVATPLFAGAAWGVAIGGHQTEDRTVVFDVAVNAGTTFVLENDNDPTFRVEVSIESRG